MVTAGKPSINTCAFVTCGWLYGTTPSNKVNSSPCIPSTIASPKGCTPQTSLSLTSARQGHTIKVHLKSYARFKPNATADLVAAVNV